MNGLLCCRESGGRRYLMGLFYKLRIVRYDCDNERRELKSPGCVWRAGAVMWKWCEDVWRRRRVCSVRRVRISNVKSVRMLTVFSPIQNRVRNFGTDFPENCINPFGCGQSRDDTDWYIRRCWSTWFTANNTKVREVWKFLMCHFAE